MFHPSTLFDCGKTVSRFTRQRHPVKNIDGTIIGASKIARDISETKIGPRQAVSPREMRHRVSNLFLVTNAIVSLSARSANSWNMRAVGRLSASYPRS